MIIVLPGYEYFEARNIYSGSKGVFNFKIVPDGDTMRATIWYGPLCLEKSEAMQEQDFPIDKDGFEAMGRWLDSAYTSNQ